MNNTEPEDASKSPTLSFQEGVDAFVVLIERQIKSLHLLSFSMRGFVGKKYLPKNVKLDSLASSYTIFHQSAISALSLVDLLKSGHLSAHACFGVSRTILESSVNASLMLIGQSGLSTRASDYAEFVFLRSLSRERSIGGWKIKTSINSGLNEKQSERYKHLSKMFLNKRGYQKNWIERSIYEKINDIGDVIGSNNVLLFSSSAAHIYELSSEYIHGSPYSYFHFFQGIARDSSENNFNISQEIMSEHKFSCAMSSFLSLQNLLESYAIFTDNKGVLTIFKKNLRDFKILIDAYEQGGAAK